MKPNLIMKEPDCFLRTVACELQINSLSTLAKVTFEQKEYKVYSYLVRYGQKITFAKSQSNSKLCFVEAAKRVVIRAKDLEVSNDKPIAILTESKNDKTFKYINDGHVTKLLREAVKDIYNIKCTKVLSKFTPHSIRVGACVKIHEEGGDATFIQTRLRWRSLAFMLYLRNTAKLATMQSKLIDNASNNI